MSISTSRYQQQLQQVQATLKPGAANIVTYESRDSITGLRKISTADGGTSLAQYVSNSTPSGVIPIAQSSTIGLTGYISQKPY